MRYVPYGDLADVPNVVVDGSPAPSTVLTLSHWPGSPTPRELARDSSGEIAFAWLDRQSDHPVRADAVSNNHLDEDGLVAVFALVDPGAALARRALLEDAARAGDFGVWRAPDGLRVAATVAALVDEGLDYPALLPLVVSVCDDPERWRDRWHPTTERVEHDLRAIDAGAITITETPELDLAVVEVGPAYTPPTGGAGERWPAEQALHVRTDRTRLLVHRDGHVELRDRYETWVRFVSRPVPRRVDLRPLAVQLGAAEPGAVQWRAGTPDGILPVCAPEGGRTGLPLERVRAIVETHLASAPPAFDPWA